MVQVQAVYRKRNPKKLDEVPKLMEKYKGNEKQLYVKVCKTYDLNPSKLYANADAWADEDKDVKDEDSAAPSAPTQLTPVPSSPAGLFTATTTVSGTSQAAVPATQEAASPASAEPTGTAHDDTEAPSKPIEVKTSEDFWMVQVQAVYRKRNPKKLDTVPKLMEKYKGNEKQLYVKVCKTYDLNPSKLYANADAWADEDKDVKDEESAAPSAPTQLTPVPSSPAGLFTATTTVSG